MKQNEYYTMFAVEDSHFWYRGMKQITSTLIKSNFKKNQKYKILDAGCGTGAGMIALSKFGEVAGVDYSPLAIELCKKRGLKKVSVASIEKLPFKNSSFDLVISSDVLGQMEVNQDMTAINEFYRVLKPEGILILRTAAFNWLYSYHDRAVHTKHRYTDNELKALLKKGKFKIIKTTYANMFLFPISFILRIASNFLKIEPKNSDVKPLNPIINQLFYFPFFIENQLIKRGSLPFGLSIIMVGKK